LRKKPPTRWSPPSAALARSGLEGTDGRRGPPFGSPPPEFRAPPPPPQSSPPRRTIFPRAFRDGKPRPCAPRYSCSPPLSPPKPNHEIAAGLGIQQRGGRFPTKGSTFFFLRPGGPLPSCPPSAVPRECFDSWIGRGPRPVPPPPRSESWTKKTTRAPPIPRKTLTVPPRNSVQRGKNARRFGPRGVAPPPGKCIDPACLPSPPPRRAANPVFALPISTKTVPPRCRARPVPETPAPPLPWEPLVPHKRPARPGGAPPQNL